jgi:glyoxylase-like metal-dependent hydrolase (beta-lactamase superfamily II)
LNDGKILNTRGVRVDPGMGYHRVEGNRRASRNGAASDLPPEIPNPYESNFFIAETPQRFPLRWPYVGGGAGRIRIQCLHTPGHTPGSMCLFVDGGSQGTADGRGLLVSGDTLFVGSCGRMDLHDCSSELMFHSLQGLARLPDSTVVWPGHNYGGRSTTIGNEKRAGLLKKLSEAEWRTMHSGL